MPLELAQFGRHSTVVLSNEKKKIALRYFSFTKINYRLIVSRRSTHQQRPTSVRYHVHACRRACVRLSSRACVRARVCAYVSHPRSSQRVAGPFSWSQRLVPPPSRYLLLPISSFLARIRVNETHRPQPVGLLAAFRPPQKKRHGRVGMEPNFRGRGELRRVWKNSI